MPLGYFGVTSDAIRPYRRAGLPVDRCRCGYAFSGLSSAPDDQRTRGLEGQRGTTSVRHIGFWRKDPAKDLVKLLGGITSRSRPEKHQPQTIHKIPSKKCTSCDLGTRTMNAAAPRTTAPQTMRPQENRFKWSPVTWLDDVDETGFAESLMPLKRV